MRIKITYICLFFYCLISAQKIEYKIGDLITNPDGSKGVVFFLYPDGSGGWMVSMNDISIAAPWGDLSDIPNMDNYETVRGDDALTAMRDLDGYENTQKIRAYQGNDPTTAAGMVDIVNGWYLPSAGQLRILYSNLLFIQSTILANGGTNIDFGVGYNSRKYYWSSTECIKDNAYAVDFRGDMVYSDGLKTNLYKVRAVKDFTYSIPYDTTLTYLWSTGSPEPYIRVKPTTDTIYTVKVNTSVGCMSMATKNIVVDNSTSRVINDTICQGDSYTQYDFNESVTGTYTKTYTSVNGCNIPFTLNLVVNPSYTDTIRDTICQKETYNKYGFNVTPENEGDFKETHNYTTQTGCDSIITLLLTVYPTHTTIINDTIIQGDSYNENGFILSAQNFPGLQTYERIISSSLACDSIVSLYLKIWPKINISKNTLLNDTICKNHPYTDNGFNLPVISQVGDFTYALVLKASSGVDSMVVLNLHVYPTTTDTISQTIYSGSSYTFGQQLLTEAGIYKDTLTSFIGCDSIVILNLSVKPSDCSNGTLIFKEDFGGNQLTDDDIKATGIPQVSGYTYIGPGQTATTNRTYFIRKIGYGNGDWHRLDDHTYFNDYTRGYLLQVDASYTAGTFYKVTVNDVCPGTKLYFSAWAVNSMVLWRQNNLSATSPNISFVIKDAATNSVLLKYDTGNIPNDSTWYPADYSYAGWLRTRPFTANWMKYGTAFTVPSNVDSLIFTLENNTTAYTGADFALDDIEIHICVPPVNIQGDTVCVGEPLTLTGNFVNDGSFVEPLEYKWQKSITGKPLDTASWIDVAGTADLNIPSVDLTDQAYYRLLVASMGNTNKVSCRAASNSAFLKVNAIVDTLVHDSICQGDNYTFNGKQLSTEGIYKDTLISSFGCDSIVTLNLSYYKIDTFSVYAHPFGICEGDYTVFYGDTLRTQGIYYHTHSCDTVYKLQLLIKPRVNIEIQDSICRGNSYNFNGKTLLQSGVYADTIPSLIADLCDTLITLTLNYKKDIRNNIFKKICQGDSYNFEGTILNTNGTFTHQFPSTENRCDSILILHLMVMPPDTTYLTISITEGESFWFGGNEITTTGTYYNQLSNKLDCDSVVILNINIVTDNSITVPQIFTPNGDGNNDFFEILNIEKYPKNHILILNRWGNKVYEGKPYMNEWDGRNYFGVTVGGNLLPVGTYFYILDLGDGSDVRKGYIYLNR